MSTLTAFATTAANTLGADAGISVFESVMENGIVRAQTEVATLDTTSNLIDPEYADWAPPVDELDTDTAEALLRDTGYEVAGAGWVRSDGQWAIEVARSQAKGLKTRKVLRS